MKGVCLSLVSGSHEILTGSVFEGKIEKSQLLFDPDTFYQMPSQDRNPQNSFKNSSLVSTYLFQIK